MLLCAKDYFKNWFDARKSQISKRSLLRYIGWITYYTHLMGVLCSLIIGFPLIFFINIIGIQRKLYSFYFWPISTMFVVFMYIYTGITQDEDDVNSIYDKYFGTIVPVAFGPNATTRGRRLFLIHCLFPPVMSILQIFTYLCSEFVLFYPDVIAFILFESIFWMSYIVSRCCLSWSFDQKEELQHRKKYKNEEPFAYKFLKPMFFIFKRDPFKKENLREIGWNADVYYLFSSLIPLVISFCGMISAKDSLFRYKESSIPCALEAACCFIQLLIYLYHKIHTAKGMKEMGSIENYIIFGRYSTYFARIFLILNCYLNLACFITALLYYTLDNLSTLQLIIILGVNMVQYNSYYISRYCLSKHFNCEMERMLENAEVYNLKDCSSLTAENAIEGEKCSSDKSDEQNDRVIPEPMRIIFFQ